MTNVMKPGKTKYINIDTRFKNNYETDALSKQNISLPERYNEVRNISIVNAEIPMSYYNISSTLGNNSFEITQDSLVKIIIVPDGEYNSVTLTSVITTLIASSNTITINVKTNIKLAGGVTPTIMKFDFTIDEDGNYSRFWI